MVRYLILLAALTTSATAWSPGPMPPKKVAESFPVVVRGKITHADMASVSTKGAIIMLADVEISAIYRGLPNETKTVRFYYWGSPHGDFTLAYQLEPGDEVVVALSKRFPDAMPKKFHTSGNYVATFAKANCAGYVYKVKNGKLRDAALPNERPISLAKFLSAIKTVPYKP